MSVFFRFLLGKLVHQALCTCTCSRNQNNNEEEEEGAISEKNPKKEKRQEEPNFQGIKTKEKAELSRNQNNNTPILAEEEAQEGEEFRRSGVDGF